MRSVLPLGGIIKVFQKIVNSPAIRIIFAPKVRIDGATCARAMYSAKLDHYHIEKMLERRLVPECVRNW